MRNSTSERFENPLKIFTYCEIALSEDLMCKLSDKENAKYFNPILVEGTNFYFFRDCYADLRLTENHRKIYKSLT